MLCLGLFGIQQYFFVRRFASTTSSPLTPLKDAAFNAFLETNDDGALVYFYLPDCSHCKELAPELEKGVRLVQASEGEEAPAFASVNAETEPAASLRFNLTRYPAVMWIRKGEMVQELKPTSRTADKIVEFVSWVRQPAVVDFETQAELDEALPTLRETLQAGSSVVIAGFAGFPGVYDALERAAHFLRGKAVFIYVKEVADTDDRAPLRTITRSAETDEAYTQRFVEPESVKRWVKKVLSELKPHTEPPSQSAEL